MTWIFLETARGGLVPVSVFVSSLAHVSALLQVLILRLSVSLSLFMSFSLLLMLLFIVTLGLLFVLVPLSPSLLDPTLVLVLLPVIPSPRILLLVRVLFLPLLSFLCCY